MKNDPGLLGETWRNKTDRLQLQMDRSIVGSDPHWFACGMNATSPRTTQHDDPRMPLKPSSRHGSLFRLVPTTTSPLVSGTKPSVGWGMGGTETTTTTRRWTMMVGRQTFPFLDFGSVNYLRRRHNNLTLKIFFVTWMVKGMPTIILLSKDC